MKWISIILFGILALGCETTKTVKSKKEEKVLVRATYYHKHEDKYGNKIAIGGRAKEGKTIAMEDAIPYGTKVEAPALKGILGDGNFIKQDRGTDVEKRKASYGTCPVVDFYVATKRKYRWLVAHIPPYIPVTMYY
jgi:hypothetical protein